MLTKEQVLAEIRGGRESQCLDGRDFVRLTDFFPVSDWQILGFKQKEGAVNHEPEEWTRENILGHLKKDVAFGIEKAEAERGISADLMFEVVQMWLWILEEPLEHEYYGYGLPFFKKVAQRYGFTDG